MAAPAPEGAVPGRDIHPGGIDQEQTLGRSICTSLPHQTYWYEHCICSHHHTYQDHILFYRVDSLKHHSRTQRIQRTHRIQTS
eukprot:scaffold270907_cov23-Tisochrysis_lutea.AAC.1